MAYKIVLSCSDSQRQQLLADGFVERLVLIKPCGVGRSVAGEPVTAAQVRQGTAEMLAMKDPPYQFAVTSYWGREKGLKNS